MHRIVAVIGILLMLLLLPACQSGEHDRKEVEDSWVRHFQAVRAADLEAIRAGVTEEAARDLSGPEAEGKAGLLKQLMPADARIVTVTVQGDLATLEMEGSQDGTKATGRAIMVHQDGGWKVAREKWTVEVAAPSGDTFGEGPAPPGLSTRLEGHTDAVTALAFSPLGEHVVSASYGDYSVRLWRLSDGQEAGKVTHPARPTGLAVLPDGTVLVADVEGKVTAYPIEPGGFGAPGRPLEGVGEAIAVRPDDKMLAGTSFQKPVALFQWPERTPVRVLEGTEDVRVLAFSPDGKLLAGAGKGNRIRIWDTGSWKSREYTLNKVSPDMDVGGLRFSPDGKWLAAAHMDSSVVVVDVGSGAEIFNTYVRDASAFLPRFSPDGAVLATAHQDDTVRLWDPGKGRTLHTLRGHRGAVQAIAFSPFGDALASGGGDREILIWRQGTQEASPAPAAEARPPATAPAAPPPPNTGGARNLLRNPDGGAGTSHWKTEGEAVLEPTADGGRCFAVRHGGSFWQDAYLPAGAKGYAALVGRVCSERVDPGGDITGLPYLYGYMMEESDDGKILKYLQGDELRLSGGEVDRWDSVGGVFEIPAGARRIRLFLNQASGGSAPTDSAARFEFPGVYLFATEAEARTFVERFRQGG